MPSPFPGMNPYLEHPRLWEDFHQRLAVEICDQIAPLIEPRYFAALNVQVSFQPVEIGEPNVQTPPRKAVPDAAVLERRTGGVATLARLEIPVAPLIVDVPERRPVKLFSVEVRETEYGALVTSIEILSPVNKQPGHHSYRDYQERRESLPLGGVSLLEIDLLRAGRRVIPEAIELLEAPYFIFLTRGTSPWRLEIWPIGLRDPIPLLPVPLRHGDPDVPLVLTQAIQAIYDRARYRLRIDYRRLPPRPELSTEDQAWIEQLLGDSEQRSE